MRLDGSFVESSICGFVITPNAPLVKSESEETDGYIPSTDFSLNSHTSVGASSPAIVLIWLLNAYVPPLSHPMNGRSFDIYTNLVWVEIISVGIISVSHTNFFYQSGVC